MSLRKQKERKREAETGRPIDGLPSSSVLTPPLHRFTPSALHPCIYVLLFCALFSAACGKVGAPVPPARLTERARTLTAIQRGSAIFLSWPLPRLVQDESSSAYIKQVEIYRLIEQRSEAPVLDSDDFEAAAQLVGFLDRAAIEAQAAESRSLRFTDPLNVRSAGSLADIRLRYAVRYSNKRGQLAAFSTTVAVEPVAAIALPPTGLTVHDAEQDEVKITWTAPTANVDGSQPAAIVGYNIYRRKAKRDAFTNPLNAEPITGTQFIDDRFDYQEAYLYLVRALSQGTSGLVESADSEAIAITPTDTFKPAPPDPVSIASANGVISLFWPTSPESDVIGYYIYRADAADAAETGWTRLTAQPLTTVTFHDDRVALGQRYFYRVTAIDVFKNESAPSRIVSETANP